MKEAFLITTSTGNNNQEVILPSPEQETIKAIGKRNGTSILFEVDTAGTVVKSTVLFDGGNHKEPDSPVVWAGARKGNVFYTYQIDTRINEVLDMHQTSLIDGLNKSEANKE